jgi:hypothetical protein
MKSFSRCHKANPQLDELDMVAKLNANRNWSSLRKATMFSAGIHIRSLQVEFSVIHSICVLLLCFRLLYSSFSNFYDVKITPYFDVHQSFLLVSLEFEADSRTA